MGAVPLPDRSGVCALGDGRGHLQKFGAPHCSLPPGLMENTGVKKGV